MEKTISQLSEIEDKANQIIKRANEEKAKLNETFEQDATKMEETIASDNAKKLNELQELANKELAKEIEVIIMNSEKHLKELEELDIKKHAELVKQVFENIIHL